MLDLFFKEISPQKQVNTQKYVQTTLNITAHEMENVQFLLFYTQLK